MSRGLELIPEPSRQPNSSSLQNATSTNRRLLRAPEQVRPPTSPCSFYAPSWKHPACLRCLQTGFRARRKKYPKGSGENRREIRTLAVDGNEARWNANALGSL